MNIPHFLFSRKSIIASAVLCSVALLFAADSGLGEVMPPADFSPIKVGGDAGLIYSLHCWQEGREIISETNLEWSSQSIRAPVNQWLTFTGADGRESQLMVMPIGTAVCQVYGRSRTR